MTDDVCNDLVLNQVARRQPSKAALRVNYDRARPDASAEGGGWSVMTPFDVGVVQTGRTAVVRVSGELDLNTAPWLEEKLVSLADEGVLDVTVDLVDLEFIDSSGVQALVAGLRRLREHSGDLELRSPKPSTLRVLKIMGLTSLFRLEAIEGAGSIDASADRASTTPAGQMADNSRRVGVD